MSVCSRQTARCFGSIPRPISGRSIGWARNYHGPRRDLDLNAVLVGPDDRVWLLSLVMAKAQRTGYAPANPVSSTRQGRTAEDPGVGEAGTRRGRDREDTRRGRRHVPAGDLVHALHRRPDRRGTRDDAGRTSTSTGSDQRQDQLGRDRKLGRVKTAAARRSIVFMPQLARRAAGAQAAVTVQPALPTTCSRARTAAARDHRSTGRGIERAVARAKLGDGISAH